MLQAPTRSASVGDVVQTGFFEHSELPYGVVHLASLKTPTSTRRSKSRSVRPATRMNKSGSIWVMMSLMVFPIVGQVHEGRDAGDEALVFFPQVVARLLADSPSPSRPCPAALSRPSSSEFLVGAIIAVGFVADVPLNISICSREASSSVSTSACSIARRSRVMSSGVPAAGEHGGAHPAGQVVDDVGGREPLHP